MRSPGYKTSALLFSIVLLGGGALLQPSHPSRRSSPGHPSEAEADSPRPDHVHDAMRFRRLQLQDEHGYVPPDGLEKARRHVELMKVAQEQRQKVRQSSATQQPVSAGILPKSWIWLGPGNIGGRIRSIVIHPTNPNSMWVGSVSGGIWHTTNGGASWQPVNDFTANLAVSTMVMDPTTSKVMYAGTGEGLWTTIGRQVFNDGIQGGGVFKSIDGGLTWRVLETTKGDPNWFYVNRLAISPDGKTVLAATNSGIWRSTDGGVSWKRGVLSTIPRVVVNDNTADVKFDPSNSQNAIAGDFFRARFSRNAGVSWNTADFSPPIGGRVELAYAPSNPSIVYASVGQNGGDIYRSTNGGKNYARVYSSATQLCSIFPLPKFCNFGVSGYANAIWVNPNNPDFVVFGGVQLARGTNSSGPYSVISGDFGLVPKTVHADHHVIVSHPGFNNGSNRIVYFGNDGGIYRADDVATVSKTSGWTSLNNNLGITQFYGGAVNPNTGIVIGGTQDNGTVRYAGLVPWDTTIGGDGGYCAADPTDRNIDTSVFYSEYIYATIQRSRNGGASADYIYCDPSQINPPNSYTCPSGKGISEAFTNANFVAPFLLDPNNPNTMLVGAESLWRSNDVKTADVPSWGLIKAPDSDGATPARNSAISAIAVSQTSSNLIVVGHNNGDIFLTTRGTSSPLLVPFSWTKIDKPSVPKRFVTSLAIDSTRNPNWIYATFGGFVSGNIYRTTDLGQTWTDVTGSGFLSLPAVPVRSMAINPIHPNFLYAGTEIGIFTSEDAGATWETQQDGPANVSVDQLFWLKETLLAATWGRGIYVAAGGLYVDPAYTGVELGTFDHPFRTIPRAVNAANSYRPIWIKAGTYNDKMTISKPVELRSQGGPVVIGKQP